jgi:biopolymer transport protein ExbD
MITNAGKVTLNGKKIQIANVRSAIQKEVAKQSNKENATVAIVAEKGVDWQHVNRVMVIAGRLGLKAIIATQPRK